MPAEIEIYLPIVAYISIRGYFLTKYVAAILDSDFPILTRRLIGGDQRCHMTKETNERPLQLCTHRASEIQQHFLYNFKI